MADWLTKRLSRTLTSTTTLFRHSPARPHSLAIVPTLSRHSPVRPHSLAIVATRSRYHGHTLYPTATLSHHLSPQLHSLAITATFSRNHGHKQSTCKSDSSVPFQTYGHSTDADLFEHANSTSALHGERHQCASPTTECSARRTEFS